MSDLETLRASAKAHRDLKEYDKAFECYDEIFKEHSGEELTEWDAWGYGYCLNKVGRFEETIEFCKSKMEKFKESAYFLSTYSWAHYNFFFKKAEIKGLADPDYEALAKKARKLIEIQPDKNDIGFKLGMMKMIDCCSDKERWHDLVQFASKMNKDFLDKEVKYLENGPKRIALPSTFEKFFLRLTEAQLKAKKYAELVETSKEGLEHFPKEIWLQRRLAQGFKGTGDLDSAIEVYKKVLDKKQWYLNEELGEALILNGKHEEALPILLDACYQNIRSFEKEKQWKLYYTTAQALEPVDVELAKKHYLFAAAIKAQKEWKVGYHLTEALKRLELELTPEIDIRSLEKELRTYWNSTKDDIRKRGKITKLFDNGIGGFITCDDRSSYFFSTRSIVNKRAPIDVYKEVEFLTEKSFDRKKNMETTIAVDVRIL